MTLRHSPVGVSTAPAALPKKHQRDQSLHRSLHLVTSALDWQVDVRLRPERAMPKTPHGPRRYKKGLGVRISEVAPPGVWSTIATADAPATSCLARTEDASRAGAEAVLIGAGPAACLQWCSRSGRRATPGTPGRGLLTALLIGSVVLA
jgi:hypothetical protein